MESLNEQTTNGSMQEVKNLKENGPQLSLTDSLDRLVKVGGIDLLEAAIDGLQNLNPSRKARKQIFLTGSEKKKERNELKKKIELWLEILESSDSVAGMMEVSSKKREIAENSQKVNLASALDATRELEKAYRTVHLFYQKTEADKIKNVVFMNASLDQLQDLDNPRFIDYASEELKQNYDRLDLRDNYSLVVIPGYLGSNKVVERWAKIAHENRSEEHTSELQSRE